MAGPHRLQPPEAPVIDFDIIAQRVFDAAVEALGAGAATVESRAKAHAPVRQMFEGRGYAVAFKSAAEIHRGVPIRQALGMSREGTSKNPAPLTAAPMEGWGRTATQKPARLWKSRRLAEANRLLEDYSAEMSRREAGGVPTPTRLTTRGAYEVRTKRAVYSTFGHLGVGGRLRGEITATPPRITGSRAEAWVISPTPYAKYQEFGTRHNAAHPFLRPATEESRGEVVGLIADAVREASRTSAGRAEITIVVRI